MTKALLEQSPQQLIKRVQSGVPFRDLETLGKSLDLSLEKLSTLIGMARATVHRRKQDGQLQTQESDRVVRYERLFSQAANVFDSKEQALGWLKSPQRGLGGAIPLEYAMTEVGAREVEKLLGRIDYGVYS
jgi:putative toxin-antitoxin system antitoxin component (TIGR02293 family)